MAVVEDVLATRLDLLGLGGYVGGIQQAGAALGVFGGEMGAAQAKALGLGIAAGAVGAGGLAFFFKAAKAAAEEAETFGRAAGNFKGSFPEGEVAAFSSEMQGLTGVADDSVAAFLGLLGTFQLTGEQAKSLALPILNASEALKAQGVSANSLAFAVGKAMQGGSATALKRSGIIIDEVGFKAADSAGRLNLLRDALQAQGGDAAIRFAKTFSGSMQGAANAAGDVVEALGAPLVGPLTVLAQGGRAVANAFKAIPTPVQTAISLIGVGLAGALVVYSAQTVIAIGLTARLAAVQLKAAAAATAMAGANAAAGGAAAGGAGGKGKGRFGNMLAGGKVALGVGAADLALSFLPDDALGGAGGALKNIGNKAAIGASLGMFFGAPGAAIGGIAGGIYGAGENLLGGGGAKKDDAAEALKQIAANTAKTAANTDPTKLPLDTGRMPGARQIGSLDLARFLA